MGAVPIELLEDKAKLTLILGRFLSKDLFMFLVCFPIFSNV